MIFDEHDLAGAVFIFSENKELIRELNYSEFEALLDSYVPAVDLANRELYAVYVEINAHYHIRNCVFFLVRFTSRGFIEQSWSVPLFQLVQHASRGPDLGAGPIGLVCASQCPIKHLVGFLWDPDLGGRRELKLLKEAVARNRLAIHFRHAESPSGHQQREAERQQAAMEQALSARLRKEYDKALRDRMAQAIREQRLRATTIVREREQAIAELKQQYNARIEEYRLMLDEHKAMLKEARERNSLLKETIDGQAEKIQGLREYFELKVEQAEALEHDQLQELKQSHQLELEAALEAETKELKELLQMREVEILYRNEQESKLHEEIDKLRRENAELVSNSGDHLLGRMLEKGISLVTYQPGAGHITLALSDMARYMENPTAYVAQYCGVSEEHYNAWLEHYHVPICQAEDKEGNLCGENINRIESPADFVFGESDCCHKHRSNKTPRLKLAGGK